MELPSPCLASETYDLHQDLALNIKCALSSKRKSNPTVKLVMPFDKVNQGLQVNGTLRRYVKGVSYYKIGAYKDLDELNCSALTSITGGSLLLVTVTSSSTPWSVTCRSVGP